MKIIDTMLDAIAERVGKQIEGQTKEALYDDAQSKGTSFSVSSEISESLADLMLMQFDIPIAGENVRSKFLDNESEEFKNEKLRNAIVQGFLTGDCLIVPSWDGHNFDNFIIPAEQFEVLQSTGKNLQAVVYIVETKRLKDGHTYQLMQYISIVPQGDGLYTNVYRLFASKDGTLYPDGDLILSEWKEAYQNFWVVPNVDRLLVARYKSHTIDPADPNSTKGVPICFGAGEHIKEIHYLVHQMHEEFGLSEKAVFADKKLFTKQEKNGVVRQVLPEGAKRVFKLVEGGRSIDETLIHDWAPDIRYQAYLEALDKQEKLVEKAVGVSSGVISEPSDMNYQNVDNVRKSTIKTQSFINSARNRAESMLTDLVYIWDVLLNYYQSIPMGQYELQFDWSDEYIDTFADRQNAILAGEAIGATDAADYRAFVMGETPDVAKENVARIQATKKAKAPIFKLGEE